MVSPRVFALSAFLVAALPLSAQVEQATILGTVTDNTGAVVGGATVTVRNSGTGERRVTKTDDRGNYQATALNIGTYEVIVQNGVDAVLSSAAVVAPSGLGGSTWLVRGLRTSPLSRTITACSRPKRPNSSLFFVPVPDRAKGQR